MILTAIPAVCCAFAGPQEPVPATQVQAVAHAVTAGTPDPSKLAAPAAASTPGAVDNAFVIGPEDQLEITVWADNRIGGNFLVRPDGFISMNLLGEVQASGRTSAQLGKEISELLKQKEIVRRPEVNVKIVQVNSKRYSINGEVMKTGAFPLVVPTRVMDALVNAGGFKDFANKKEIVIIRGQQRLKFNWNDVVKGKRTEQNVFLEPGDIIIVK
jgi:polysaccharide export outer membrane protein